MNLSSLFDLSLIGRRDMVGLEFEDETYTFGEIDVRSNRFAQLLLRRLAQPELKRHWPPLEKVVKAAVGDHLRLLHNI